MTKNPLSLSFCNNLSTMDKYCSFCANEKLYLSDINVLKLNVLSWLSKLVVFEENLPKVICYACLCEIKVVNSFVEKCNNSHKMLVNLSLTGMNHEAAPTLTQVIQDSKIDVLDNNELSNGWMETVTDFDEDIRSDNIDIILAYPEETNYSFEIWEYDKPDEHCETTETIADRYYSDNDKSTNLTNLKGLSEENNKNIIYNFKCRLCDYKCNGREACAFHMRKIHFNDNRNITIKEIRRLVICLNKRYKLQGEYKDTDIFSDNIDPAKNTQDEEDRIKKKIKDLINLPEVFVCRICGIKFERKISLKMHIKKLHFGNSEQKNKKKKETYLCPECGASYSSFIGFQTHSLRHENNIVKCEFCPKTFVSKVLLGIHRRIHTGEVIKNYPCHICGKMFRSQAHVRVHLRFHLNEKPFKCDLCKKSYSVKSHLTQHMKIHSGVKDHICPAPGCKKAYGFLNCLKKHYSTCHMPDSEKDYSCEFCPSKFAMKAFLKDHYRRSHRQLALNKSLL